MSIKFEDGNTTLRLFATKEEALKFPGAHNLTAYFAGFLVQDKSGRWIDADGRIPESWKPDPSKTYLLT